MKAFFKKILNAFILKDGEVSKTSIFISLGTLVYLFLWLSQSLLGGVSLWGYIVPEFNAGAAASVMMTLATLYLVNHSKLMNKPGTAETLDDARKLEEEASKYFEKRE